jgi:FAD dependent oxidoreductase TIGR03364
MARRDGPFDLAVVGAGIVGLACAYAAARAGKRVVVLDRDACANGASIRNFGFITVTGQPAGACWRRARRSRDVWAEVAAEAGIALEQSGLLLTVRRPEARAVVQQFLTTPMGRGCTWMDAAAVHASFPDLNLPGEGALFSPHELRVESRTAVPRLAAWLEARWGVVFRWSTAVHRAAPPVIDTSAGPIGAGQAVICPGDDFTSLCADEIAPLNLTRCRLSMLKLESPGFRLPAGIMSDLGLVRYGGYAALPQAQALKRRLEREQPAHLAEGVHLIVAQGADGGLIVGDSHHYAATPEPFASAAVEALILQEFEAALGFAPPPVVQRWTGTYASSATETAVVRAPRPDVRLVIVTSGTGASTAFALGEEVTADLFGERKGNAA